MNQPPVRYASSVDGVSIAHTTDGAGEPVFMSSPLTLSHQALERRTLETSLEQNRVHEILEALT